LYVRGMIGHGGISIIRRCARAARTSNHALDRVAREHIGVVANVNEVVRPIQIDARNMRLVAQRPLDRISAFRAVDIVQLKCRVLLPMCHWMAHD
jgi:hypothetical protein